MFEKPQKAQVVRIKIEAVSLESTSMAPSLDAPLLLRVVRCLLSRADMRGRDDATRAGVVQASREETAASPDSVGDAKPLWGFDGWPVGAMGPIGRKVGG